MNVKILVAECKVNLMTFWDDNTSFVLFSLSPDLLVCAHACAFDPVCVRACKAFDCAIWNQSLTNKNIKKSGLLHIETTCIIMLIHGDA